VTNQSEWEVIDTADGPRWTAVHWVDASANTDGEVEDAFKRHLLLEFLSYLKLLEYERGYDGVYYDIYLPIRV